MLQSVDADFKESAPLAIVSTAGWTPSFSVSIDAAIEMKRQKKRFFESVMEEGKHYGIIPGCLKPSLYKAGAEMLLSNMGLQSAFGNELPPVLDYTGEAHGGEPMIKYNRHCTIYRQTGPTKDDRIVIARASGSCSSWEDKYRYRGAERVCPTCGKPAIIKGKEEYGGGFVCFKKKDGCGAKFKDNDAKITGQETGKVANPNVIDLDNTILKMADKRALTAATLIATGCSDIFTQDVEDMPSMNLAPPEMLDGKREEKAAAPPSLVSIRKRAVSCGLIPKETLFGAWAREFVPSCKDIPQGKPPTPLQLRDIELAIHQHENLLAKKAA
jgi:hypothetical protein